MEDNSGKDKNILPYITYMILLFLFVYDCYFLHFTFTSNMILALLGIVVYVVHFAKHAVIKKKSMGCILLLILMLGWAIVVQAINGTYDMTFIKNELLRNIVFPFFSAFLIAECGKRIVHSFNELCKQLVNISIIQCIIILIAFFNSNFRNFIISIQTISARELNSLDAGIRSVGLGTRFDFGAFTMSILMVICCYLCLISEKKERKKYIMFLVMQMIAGMFLARSIIIGVCTVGIFIVISNDSVVKKFGLGIKVIGIIFIVIIVALTIFPNIVAKYSDSIAWMFQYVIRDSSYGGTDTLKVLSEEMYFIPQKLSTWLIGDGIFETAQGYAYMNTDPLIMRYLLYWGIPGIIMFLAFIISIINIMKRNGKLIMCSSEKNTKHICCCVIFCF